MNINAPGFCNWLQGVLEANPTPETGISATTTAMIKTRLSDAFLHDIDQTYPKEQRPHLQAAHKGLAYSVMYDTEYDEKQGHPRC